MTALGTPSPFLLGPPSPLVDHIVPSRRVQTSRGCEFRLAGDEMGLEATGFHLGGAMGTRAGTCALVVATSNAGWEELLAETTGEVVLRLLPFFYGGHGLGSEIHNTRRRTRVMETWILHA